MSEAKGEEEERVYGPGKKECRSQTHTRELQGVPVGPRTGRGMGCVISRAEAAHGVGRPIPRPQTRNVGI